MKKKIICIDDDAVQQQYYSVLFRKMKIDYNLFSNPEKALSYLNSCNKSEIGLIITDYRMPLINGCELIGNLASHIKSNVPIIMVTSQHETEILELESISGCIKQLLRKPFGHKEFQELILQYTD